MLKEDRDYSIRIEDGDATLAGVLRLNSPLAYEELFKPIAGHIENQDGYRIDITELKFLNSCGVTSLSRLILSARKHQHAIHFIASTGVAWHGRTLKPLQKLHTGMKVEYRD